MEVEVLVFSLQEVSFAGHPKMWGTSLFAPTEDRDIPGEGFTHKVGDRVEISATGLGSLTNDVRKCSDCAPWTFGSSALMRNLASRNLL